MQPRVMVIVALAGCQGFSTAAGSIAVFTGGAATGVVSAKQRGNAVFSVGGAAHGGQRDVYTGEPNGATEVDRSAGISVFSEGVGIASDDDLGWAAHTRMQLGMFGDDYFFGEIDLEAGIGFLRSGQFGAGVLAGWNYGGQFLASHSLPFRGLVYWSADDIVIQGSAHVSYRDDSGAWNGRGAELGVATGSLGFGLRLEDQAGAVTLSASMGWVLHTAKRKKR